jgi:hypothetical protein
MPDLLDRDTAKILLKTIKHLFYEIMRLPPLADNNIKRLSELLTNT